VTPELHQKLDILDTAICAYESRRLESHHLERKAQNEVITLRISQSIKKPGV